MATLLEQLRSMTTVVADTGDFNSIGAYRPQDATTNPTLLADAAKDPAYQSIVDDVLRTAREKCGQAASQKEVAGQAFKTLAVAFGRKILEIVPDRVSTEIDARLSYDREKTLAEAHDVIFQYDQAGVPRERVLIKVASTWEGIKAAEILEQEGIHCNLTLLFGMHQAIACADPRSPWSRPSLVAFWTGRKRTPAKTMKARKIQAFSLSPTSTITSRSSATKPRSWVPASGIPERSSNWQAVIS